MGHPFPHLELTMPLVAAEIITPAEAGELALLDRVHGAFEVRDPASAAHVHRMAAVAGLLAERLGMGSSTAWMVRAAASLHDIGKFAISKAVLLKPGALNAAERSAVERHTVTGRQMLHQVDTPIFRLAATIALTHHERWDGDGYPLGLRGKEIPLVGRIAAVADVFDALLSRRPYRAALDLGSATAILRDGCGSQFDPEVIEALFGDLGGALAAR